MIKKYIYLFYFSKYPMSLFNALITFLENIKKIKLEQI